jgi:hypothetical protein
MQRASARRERAAYLCLAPAIRRFTVLVRRDPPLFAERDTTGRSVARGGHSRTD